MLAFKTDKVTLDRRLELQKRLRDQAESNMSAELTRLKAAVEVIMPLELCQMNYVNPKTDYVISTIQALEQSKLPVSGKPDLTV